MAPIMAPSRGLLYYFSSIINAHFQRTMPGVISFCLFKEIYFLCAFYSRCIRARAISNSEKLFYIEPVATLFGISLGISTAKQHYTYHLMENK